MPGTEQVCNISELPSSFHNYYYYLEVQNFSCPHGEHHTEENKVLYFQYSVSTCTNLNYDTSSSAVHNTVTDKGNLFGKQIITTIEYYYNHYKVSL